MLGTEISRQNGRRVFNGRSRLMETMRSPSRPIARAFRMQAPNKYQINFGRRLSINVTVPFNHYQHRITEAYLFVLLFSSFDYNNAIKTFHAYSETTIKHIRLNGIVGSREFKCSKEEPRFRNELYVISSVRKMTSEDSMWEKATTTAKTMQMTVKRRVGMRI